MAGTFEQEFAKALANLSGSGDFSPLPSPASAPAVTFTNPSYKPIDMTAGMISPSSFKGSPAGGPSYFSFGGLGSDLLHGLMGVSNFLTDYLAKQTGSEHTKVNDIANMVGGPVGNFLYNITANQWGAWNDGKWTLGDVPGLGGLIGTGANGYTTHDIFGNIGYKEAEAQPGTGWSPLQHRKGNLDIGDVGEFAGDVLLDPLTYLTFGTGSAIKAGAQGAAKEAAAQLAAHGLEAGLEIGGKNLAVRVAERVGAKATEDAIAKGASLEAANAIGERAATAARVAVENAGKTARAAAQNSLVGASLPFSNKIVTFGEKPGFLKVADSLIGEVGKAPVVRKLSELGLNPEQQAAFLKSVYGVEDAAKMTSQMSEHFAQNIGKVTKAEDLLHYVPFNPESALFTITDPAERGLARSMIEDIGTTSETPAILGNTKTNLHDLTALKSNLPQLLGQRAEELFQFAHDAPGMVNQEDILQSIEELTKLGEGIKDVGHTAEFLPALPRTMQSMDDVFNLFKFAQDMGGSSPLGRAIGDKLAFLNPRSLGSKIPFINEAAGKVRNAENFIRSNQDWSFRELAGIQRMAKGLSEADMRKIPYILEGKFPGEQNLSQFLADSTNKEQLLQVADSLKQVFDRQATREMGAGALKGTIDGYFPHVLDKSIDPETLQKILSDPEMSKYLGRSAANQFNKTRKGFESFAQWDEAIHSLQTARKTVTDPEQLGKIDETLARLENLFQRDPIKATAERMAKGIKSTAMSQLQGELRNMGTLRLPEDLAKDGAQSLTKDFIRLDAATAQKFGLPAGTAIHKEVLQGLEKTQHLFTDAGINKFVENLTSATNIWKNLVTTYVPAHHFNNLLGNIANTTLAGVGISDYKEAGELLAKVRAGTITKAEREFLQEAADHGVLGGGQLIDVIDPLRRSRLAQEKGVLHTIENKITDTKWAQTMRGLGNNIEDLSRLATYIHGNEVTGSAKLAADMVRKYLFNFGELTNADRGIKLLAPFWSWTKNNLPLHLQEILHQPKYYATLQKIQQTLNVDNQDGVLAPDYIQKDYLKIPGTENSYFNPRIPANDLKKLDDPLGLGLGLMSPFLKMPFEVGLNKQVFNGAPIDPYKTDNGSYDPARLGKYFLQQSGVGNKAASFFDSNSSILEDLAALLLGKVQTVDPAKELRSRMYDRKAEQRAQKARAKAN
jgi:hypothetical protein